MNIPRYFIGFDGSGHSYLVPLEKKDEWDVWTEISEDDERSWDVPDYAVYIDGGLLTFSDPQMKSYNDLR